MDSTVPGDGVSSVVAGDEVFGTVMKSYLGDGSFAEYVTVSESLGLAKTPDTTRSARASPQSVRGVRRRDAWKDRSPSLGVGRFPPSFRQEVSASLSRDR